MFGIGRYQGQAERSYRLSTADEISALAVTLNCLFSRASSSALVFYLLSMTFARVFLWRRIREAFSLKLIEK